MSSTYDADLSTNLDSIGEEGIDFYRLRYVSTLYDNLKLYLQMKIF